MPSTVVTWQGHRRSSCLDLLPAFNVTAALQDTPSVRRCLLPSCTSRAFTLTHPNTFQGGARLGETPQNRLRNTFNDPLQMGTYKVYVLISSYTHVSYPGHSAVRWNNTHLGLSCRVHGVGAKSATVAHVAMQAPRPVLHPMMATGAPTMVTPNVKPAAA